MRGLLGTLDDRLAKEGANGYPVGDTRLREVLKDREQGEAQNIHEWTANVESAFCRALSVDEAPFLQTVFGGPRPLHETLLYALTSLLANPCDGSRFYYAEWSIRDSYVRLFWPQLSARSNLPSENLKSCLEQFRRQVYEAGNYIPAEKAEPGAPAVWRDRVRAEIQTRLLHERSGLLFGFFQERIWTGDLNEDGRTAMNPLETYTEEQIETYLQGSMSAEDEKRFESALATSWELQQRLRERAEQAELVWHMREFTAEAHGEAYRREMLAQAVEQAEAPRPGGRASPRGRSAFVTPLYLSLCWQPLHEAPQSRSKTPWRSPTPQQRTIQPRALG